MSASEALAMGLVNRVVPRGQSRAAAESLARDLASFPQGCLRADRLSALTQWGEPEADALREETSRGLDVVRSGETQAGAIRFAKGAGRHGSFD